MREVIRRFETVGVDDCLTRQADRPHNPSRKITPTGLENLRALLHQSMRTLGKGTGIWTLEQVAEVSFAQGLTQEQASGEAIWLALQRLGVGWKRTKRWITSPDPEYARKKGPATV